MNLKNKIEGWLHWGWEDSQIYVIHPNVNHYLSYVLDSKEVRKKLGNDTMFHFDQSPLVYAEIWKPIEISFAKLSGVKKGDIPDLMIRNGRLFLNEKAYECLRETLEAHGEFLPVTFGSEAGYLFNILRLADDIGGLNQKLSTRDEHDDLQSLVFHEEKMIKILVFRTSFDDYMGVYCNGAFKQAVENAGLKGLVFSLDLWNIFPTDSSV